MKPSQLTKALTVCVQAKQPVCIWGPPGIGKSEITKQTASMMNLELKDVRAVLLDPVDLRGLPSIEDGKTTWAIPDFLPTKGKGILFLDELNRAPVLVQNACFQLILDRKLGDYTLPEGWSIVAACNNSGGGVTKMPDALANRFVHLDAEVDSNDWCKWAVNANVEPVLLAFIRFRPELLHQYDPKEKAFPTPRSWEFVSRIVAENTQPDIEHSLFVGAVGNGAAVEFSAYIRLFKTLPNIDAILTDPNSQPVPDQPATLYAVASALARRATAGNLSRVITYLKRMPEEYSVLCVKDATQRDNTLTTTSEYTKWAIAHQAVMN